MKHIVLERFLPSVHGTFGVMQVGNFVFFTLEEEWKDNAPNESCIPAGTYELQRVMYNRGGFMTYEIVGVPDRSQIKFHPGNTEEDTQGCILTGLMLGFLKVRLDEEEGRPRKKLAVLKSRAGFEKFMGLLEGVDEVEIKITWS